MREVIRPGTPCVFIAKEKILSLDDLGYETMEVASVPPANFELPRSEKKKYNSLMNAGHEKRRNSCFIVLARAI